jgi:hypothetical protein
MRCRSRAARGLTLPPPVEAFVYRRWRPAQTPLYRLLESLHERLKGCR